MGNDIVSESSSAQPIRLLAFSSITMDAPRSHTSPNISIISAAPTILSEQTVLTCPEGSVVDDGERWLGCKLCPALFYVIGGGKLQGKRRDECLPCPYGGDCALGGSAVAAQRGFWGQVVQGKEDKQPRLVFTRCPDG